MDCCLLPKTEILKSSKAANVHQSHKASSGRSTDVRNPVYLFPEAQATSSLMTKDMIHDSISTNMVTCQYLRLCCCHDKSSFFPLLINIYQLGTWSGASPRASEGSRMWYTAHWWYEIHPHSVPDILWTFDGHAVTWNLFCITRHAAIMRTASYITMNWVFKQHTVHHVFSYNICNHISFTALYHFDVIGERYQWKEICSCHKQCAAAAPVNSPIMPHWCSGNIIAYLFIKMPLEWPCPQL